jgi:hypothetical protein
VILNWSKVLAVTALQHYASFKKDVVAFLQHEKQKTNVKHNSIAYMSQISSETSNNYCILHPAFKPPLNNNNGQISTASTERPSSARPTLQLINQDKIKNPAISYSLTQKQKFLQHTPLYGEDTSVAKPFVRPSFKSDPNRESLSDLEPYRYTKKVFRSKSFNQLPVSEIVKFHKKPVPEYEERARRERPKKGKKYPLVNAESVKEQLTTSGEIIKPKKSGKVSFS